MYTEWTGQARLTLLVVAVAVSAIQPQLRAQADGSHTAAAEPPTETLSINFERVSFGMARGQTARFTVFNPNEPEHKSELIRQISLVVDMMDQQGSLIAQSAAIEIPPGEFRSIDFNRDALLLPGEPGTGRLQARPVLRIAFARSALQGFDVMDQQGCGEHGTACASVSITNIPRLMDSIEIIDNLTGKTTVVMPALLLPAVQKVRVAK
jgi:hypothetical protein